MLNNKASELIDTLESMGFDSDINTIRTRAKILMQAARDGETVTLTDEDRVNLDFFLKTMMADILDVDPEEITDDIQLADELGMDSLAFLELFDELKETFGIEMDVNVAVKYAQDHPVEYYGDFKEQMFLFLEKPDEVFKELGIDKDELLNSALQNIDEI